MRLSAEESAILAGKEGDTLRKVLETVVRFGDCFGASELVPLDAGVHLVTSFGFSAIEPVYEIMDQLIAAGLRAKLPFTVDPRPCDYANVRVNPLERLVFDKFMYSRQKSYEAQLSAVGLKDGNAFTCACYFDEVGNKPSLGQNLAWAESSAVVFANSVLGARSNRNSGVLELLCGVVGKAPKYGLLTDAGRKARWIIDLRCRELPEAQLLGSAIGLRVVEDVPYIVGLDRFFGGQLGQDAQDYLKDLGAAAASNGAVGLYHVEGLTPEARAEGKKLVQAGAQSYTIDEAELERIRKTYPLLWKKPEAKPQLAFVGCPHLSKVQVYAWLDRLEAAARAQGKSRLKIRTIMTTAPDVEAEIREDSSAMKRIGSLGVGLSSICPLMYLNNPLCHGKAVITSSNKLRTYTAARYCSEAELATAVARGRL